jgi:hypothetical protein
MKKIMLLLCLAGILCACSNPLVFDDKPIASGTITKITGNAVTLKGESDADTLVWHPKMLKDALSYHGGYYTLPLYVGDSVTVYQEKNDILLSKIPLTEAGMYTKALNNAYWESFVTHAGKFALGFIVFFIAFFVLCYFNRTYLATFSAFIVLCIASLAFMLKLDIRRNMAFDTNGTIVSIENGLLTLNNKNVYGINTPKDFIDNLPLTVNDTVCVYRYQDMRLRPKICLSKTRLNPEVLSLGYIWSPCYLNTGVMLFIGLAVSIIFCYILRQIALFRPLTKEQKPSIPDTAEKYS